MSQKMHKYSSTEKFSRTDNTNVLQQEIYKNRSKTYAERRIMEGYKDISFEYGEQETENEVLAKEETRRKIRQMHNHLVYPVFFQVNRKR